MVALRYIATLVFMLAVVPVLLILWLTPFSGSMIFIGGRKEASARIYDMYDDVSPWEREYRQEEARLCTR